MLGALLMLIVPYAEAYEKHETDGKPMLVLVTADWCPGCVKMKNDVLPHVKTDYTLVDFDKEPKLAKKLMKGTMIPQLILFRKDKSLKRVIGPKTIADVERFIKD